MATPSPAANALFRSIRRDAAAFRLRKPSHTDEQIRVLGIEQNEHGATLIIGAAWAGHFPTVADAAAFAAFVQERANG